jgi:hypothetical protein
MTNRTMRKALLAALTVGFAPTAALAQIPGNSFGLGLHVGDPNFGITGKYWLTSDDAIQAVVGWRGTYYGAQGPVLTVDWQRRVIRIDPRTPVVRFGIDLGVGGSVGYVGENCYRDVFDHVHCSDSHAGLVLRVPVAFSAYFPKPRVEAYAEIALGLVLAPWFGGTVMGGVGGRFYF